MMFDHLGIKTRKMKEMAAFYEAALAPLGYSRQRDYGVAVAFGHGGEVPLWISEAEGDAAISSIHLALSSADRAAVDAFYKAAIAAGGKDNGPPGLRPQYHESYYGAFVLDPDGNNLEAVCHKPE